MSEDDRVPDDESIKKDNYNEFELDSIDKKNLEQIKEDIKDGDINTSNKKDILEYLEKLYIKLTQVKKDEFAYEGDANFNVNRRLQEVKELIEKVERT